MRTQSDLAIAVVYKVLSRLEDHCGFKFDADSESHRQIRAVMVRDVMQLLEERKPDIMQECLACHQALQPGEMHMRKPGEDGCIIWTVRTK